MAGVSFRSRRLMFLRMAPNSHEPVADRPKGEGSEGGRCSGVGPGVPGLGCSKPLWTSTGGSSVHSALLEQLGQQCHH